MIPENIQNKLANNNLTEAQSPASKPSVVFVATFFTAFLVLSNLTAFKLAQIGNITFTAGLIFFPVTYLFDNILTEVYGFKVSRRVIWAAQFSNLIIFLGTWSTIYLTPSPFWNQQAAYAAVYEAVPRIFVASMIGYFMGEFANSTILAKLKILTSGRHLWFRAIASTSVGSGIDSIFFMHVAFLFVIPYVELWKIIATMYTFKVVYEICAIPLTYKVANYLKRKDKVDHYDYGTSFNPFSLAVD